MLDAFGLVGLALLLFSGKGSEPQPRPAPRQLPSGALPAGTVPMPPAPWPQVAPTGLPPFPGSGWEFDEPPPLAVQQRAGQLLSQLWARGAGTFKIEQTEGRWIAYRAEKVKSGKQGVVAYRLAVSRAAPSPGVQSQRPPAAPPATAAKPAPKPAPRVVKSPGVPQKQPAAQPVAWDVDVLPAQVQPAVSPLAMPDLKIGVGLKPAAPDPNVVLVQQKLRVVPADGRFGKDTQTAVIKFQQQTGLAPSNQTVEQLRARGFGAVKQATWVKLFAVRV